MSMLIYLTSMCFMSHILETNSKSLYIVHEIEINVIVQFVKIKTNCKKTKTITITTVLNNERKKRKASL